MKIPRPIYDRLLAMQKTLSRRAQEHSMVAVEVTISSVFDAAVSALEESLRKSGGQ